MSNKKQKDNDNEMSENSVNEILFSEETQEKESKDSKKKSKRLITSSTQESGSGSPGEPRKMKPTPPDATGLVRIDKESGKLKVDTKAVALENKKLKANEFALQDQIVALRAQLDMYESPGGQPDPSPPNDLPIPGGLEGALSKNQFETMLKFIDTQVRTYQDSQSASKVGKEMVSTAPSLDLDAPSTSRISSHTGLAEKSFAKPSHKNILGSLLGDGAEEDLDVTESTDGHDEDIIG